MKLIDTVIYALKSLTENRVCLIVEKGKQINIVGCLKGIKAGDILNICNFFVRLTKPNVDTGLHYNKMKVNTYTLLF